MIPLNILPSFLLPSTTIISKDENRGLQLQTAIYACDTARLEKLVKESPDLLTKPLPCGELPLIKAAKEQKMSSVKTLLELGADPMQKDGQNLSAIDHAILTNEPKIAAEILSHFIREDINSVQSALQDNRFLNQAKTTVREIQAASHKTTQSKNFSLIQKAILPKDKQTLQAAADVAHPLEGDSVLHLAVLSGDIEIFNHVLGVEKNLDRKNNKGLTAFHYAAALGRFDMMRALVAKGANVRVVDSNQISPIALLGAAIQEKDPLKIGKMEIFIFLSSLAIWSSYFIPTEGLGRNSYLFFSGRALAELIVDSVNYGMVFKTWRGWLLNMIGRGILYSSDSRSLIIAWEVLSVGYLSKQLLSGLSSCWKNASLGRGKALLKAAIAYGPKAKTTLDLAKYLAIFLAVLSPSVSFISRSLACMDRCIGSSYDCTNYREFPKCIEKSWEVSDLCSKDARSEKCKKSNDQFEEFIRRWEFYSRVSEDFAHSCLSDKFGFGDKFSTCVHAFYQYEAACDDPDVPECLEAETWYREKIEMLNSDLNDDEAEEIDVETTKNFRFSFEGFGSGGEEAKPGPCPLEELKKSKDLIGCKPNDDLEQCKIKYKQKMREMHPDKNNSPDANEKTAELNNAMEFIEKNPKCQVN